MKVTPKPRVDVLQALPELAHEVATTIRLHPRRGHVADLAGSKIGGAFLWPEDEPWPTLPSMKGGQLSGIGVDYPWAWKWTAPDNTPIELTPVLQLNKRDVPDFPFPEGKDLFQLLWQALATKDTPYSCLPHVIWRSTDSVKSHRHNMPVSLHIDPNYVPRSCYLTFERVAEYPHIAHLSDEQIERLEKWISQLDVSVEGYTSEFEEFASILYQYELSTCPDTKLGGYPDWIQDPEVPTCDCSREMDHLLTIQDIGIDSGSYQRWLPVEDHDLWNRGLFDLVSNAPDLSLGGGAMYYFVCRSCENWPIKVVYQR
ncbi:MAG: hypothetical protein OHK0046_50860 [Anaerolineae bacterium]